MTKIVILNPLKCARCGFHYKLGDSIVFAHGCAMPITVSFDCSNRRIVSVNGAPLAMVKKYIENQRTM